MEIINNPFKISTTTLEEEKDRTNNQTVLVAIENDEVVGCVNLREERFWALAIKKEHQRKGIGKQLVTKCEEIFKQQGKSTIGCYAHPDSHDYYRKLGYEDSWERQTFENHASIRMTKEL